MNWLQLTLIIGLIAIIENRKLTKEENEKRLETCGDYKISKIFRGTKAEDHEAPWAVRMLRPHDGKKSQVHLCSGTIISPRHILTASHCVSKTNDKENTGIELNMEFKREDCPEHQNIIVTELKASKVQVMNRTDGEIGRAKFLFLFKFCRQITEKDTYQIQYQDDIMIIETADDIEFTPNLKPACVARDTEDNSPDSVLHLYGFGVNPPSLNSPEDSEESINSEGTLRKEETKIMDHNKEGTTNRIDPRYFEARSVSKTQILCAGDSGGGAMRVIDGRVTVVGIVARSSCSTIGAREEKASEIYTSAGFYAEEICDYTGICTPPRSASTNFGLIVLILILIPMSTSLN